MSVPPPVRLDSSWGIPFGLREGAMILGAFILAFAVVLVLGVPVYVKVGIWVAIVGLATVLALGRTPNGLTFEAYLLNMLRLREPRRYVAGGETPMAEEVIDWGSPPAESEAAPAPQIPPPRIPEDVVIPGGPIILRPLVFGEVLSFAFLAGLIAYLVVSYDAVISALRSLLFR